MAALAAFRGNPAQRNGIIADLVTPASAVGVFFPGHTTLSAFDLDGDPIVSISGVAPFVGIVSDVPISRVVGDRGSSGQIWQSFLFVPIPEPATLVLLLAAGAVTLARRRPVLSWRYIDRTNRTRGNRRTSRLCLDRLALVRPCS